MEEKDRIAFCKNYMARFVAQMKILDQDVLGKYQAWIEGLSDERFEVYLSEFAAWSNPVSLEKVEPAKETGAFIAFGAFPGHEAPYRYFLESHRREASIYYALALWKSYEAKRVESAGPSQFEER